MHFRQLERAAAEIADDPVGSVEAGHHAERGQFRFALTGQHIDLGAADALGLRHEGLAVGGVTAGSGGYRPELRNLHPIAERAEAPQGGKRLVHGVGGQQSGRLHLAPEPAQHLLVEDRGRAAGEAFVHDQAHGVRADVDDGDRRPVIETTLRDVHCGSTPLKSGRGGV